MSLSKTLYKLQLIDSELDLARKRIEIIDSILNDHKELDLALKTQEEHQKYLTEKQKDLKFAEHNVEDQNQKIAQNQKRLYGGAITNPKELEDLQLESTSLQKYLSALEDRQLEAMLDMEQTQETYNQSSAHAEEISHRKETESAVLQSEKEELVSRIEILGRDRDDYIADTPIPNLPTYEKIRKSSGGIAVTLMVGNSCSACGASIPSAIEQEARSPTKMSYCPACKRILHPKPR